jgi:polysaccharide export outer membrane protein
VSFQFQKVNPEGDRGRILKRALSRSLRRSLSLALGAMVLVPALAVPAASAQEAKPILTPAPAPETTNSQTAMPPAQTTAPATTPPGANTAEPPAGAAAAATTDEPSAPAQAAPGPVPSTDASRYVIGPEDVLQVTVWKEPTLSGTFPVRPDGMISLVLLGDVKAAGMTPMQLGADITERLKKDVRNPLVTVVVTGVNSQRIYMVGEVAHVGPIGLVPGMTPLQAIAAAGGLSPFAKSKKIYILRGSQGHQTKIPFNYKEAFKGDNSQNIQLLPDDTVVVP